MAKKVMTWKTRGMNQDMSVSAFNPEFAFENRNLRLSTNEGNTLMSWVNEKGTSELSVFTENANDTYPSTTLTISGTPLGVAVLNKYLVLFTHNNNSTDYIYRLKYTDVSKTALCGKILYSSNLGFDLEYPIETSVSYESELIQKVYWVDGKNQPRFINIVGDIKLNNDTQFDFIPELQLKETVTVQKMLGANGMFAPGVIQYAFTYYNKYGQESNIFYTTPLYYLSYKERGASPEDKVENAFKITVDDVDRNFDYLRIYSIQRTSLDGTPICKRIQDIELTDGLDYRTSAGRTIYIAHYTDTGYNGDTIDPTELLYKGGEKILANTLEQKDGTLFFGNIEIKRNIDWNSLKDTVQTTGAVTLYSGSAYTRKFYPVEVYKDNYIYYNQLTSYSNSSHTISVPCGGFKRDDYYRCGLQFQDITGKWSEPIFVRNHQIDSGATPSFHDDNYGKCCEVPIIQATISNACRKAFYDAGYKKVRPVVVFPQMQDRVTICQGVGNPTMYTSNNASNNSPYRQASWFFRFYGNGQVNLDGSVEPIGSGSLMYANRGIAAGVPETGDVAWNPIPIPNTNTNNIRLVEIQGHFDQGNQFQIDWQFLSMHSPEIEFDDSLQLIDFTDVTGYHVGNAYCSNTFSDIDIQTETPTVSTMGGGFIHKSFNKTFASGIVAGLFYDDCILDDWSDRFAKDDDIYSPFKWMVYPWHKSGSLNNDCTRPANMGTQTAKLKKKIISNLRYSYTNWIAPDDFSFNSSNIPQLYFSDQTTIIKVGGHVYQGNIDTSLIPDNADGNYCAYDSINIHAKHAKTSFTSTIFYKTFSKLPDQDKNAGLYKWNTSETAWTEVEGDIGNDFIDIVMKKEPVRMKYKSTPHLVLDTNLSYTNNTNIGKLPVIEIRRNNVTDNTVFGGKSDDALRENTWVPCGEPVTLPSSGSVSCYYSYGDTYYQRYDCLKTYPFTKEDPNQIVEIGSFMLETHVNIDGRYDRNRGQMNNLNMTPQNFNLFNPVYNQIDNFFSYKIMDADSYKNEKYPNQITWSKSKNNAADVDMWTNVTLASILEMDGDKGKINSIQRFNDQLICFQDSGISQILYNENVQISSTEGVPIEIANSGKVQGKRYISNTIGCSNKWSICKTPVGLYFMDSNDKNIYRFTGGLENISQTGGFNAWSKANIPPADTKWAPLFPAVSSNDTRSNFVCYYDSINQDILWINNQEALAFSERLGVFTSFYDYGNTPFFVNLGDTGIWIGSDHRIWKHRGGNYGEFFGVNKPFYTTLISNAEPQIDKIFTNLEFRACVDGDGVMETVIPTGQTTPVKTGKFIPTLPFDYLETWDEYQHGYTALEIKNGHNAMLHGGDSSSLKRKFRIWRCDVPRNNCLLDSGTGSDYRQAGTTYPYSLDSELGVSRHIRKSQDRMRNPWIYLKLQKNAAGNNETLDRTEVHDLVMTYFS